VWESDVPTATNSPALLDTCLRKRVQEIKSCVLDSIFSGKAPPARTGLLWRNFFDGKMVPIRLGAGIGTKEKASPKYSGSPENVARTRASERCEWDSNPRNNGFAIHRLRPLGYRTVLFVLLIRLAVRKQNRWFLACERDLSNFSFERSSSGHP